MSRLLNFALGRVPAPTMSEQRKYNKFAMSAVEILTTNLPCINDFFFQCSSKTGHKISQPTSNKELADKKQERSFNTGDNNINENSVENEPKSLSQKHDFFLKDGEFKR